MRKGDICFSRGLKIGALGILLTALTMGCDVGDPGTKQEQTQGSQYELDSYIFKRYDFVNTPIFNSAVTQQEDVYTRISEIKDDYCKKVNEIKQQLDQEITDPNENALKGTLARVYTSLQERTGLFTVLDTHILSNYNATSEYFAQILNEIESKNDQDKFKVCYDMLADRAYRDSLHLQDFVADFQKIPANEDILQMQAELAAVGLSNDYHQIEDELNRILTRVAKQNNLQPNTLRECFNDVLFNEGLYGIRDYIAIYSQGDLKACTSNRAPVYTPLDYRTRQTFHYYINEEMQKLQTNNLANDIERMQ